MYTLKPLVFTFAYILTTSLISAEYVFLAGSANNNTYLPDNPPPLYGHSFVYEKSTESFLIFGGITDVSFSNGLWRFFPVTSTFRFVDGSNSTGDTARLPNRPSPRNMHAAVTDDFGNVYTFGGQGTSASGTSYATGVLSDIWVWNQTTSTWRYIVGSLVPDEYLPDFIEPRILAGHWFDSIDACFYIFAGQSTSYSKFLKTFLPLFFTII